MVLVKDLYKTIRWGGIMPTIKEFLVQFNTLFTAVISIIEKLRTTAEEMGYTTDLWLEALERLAGPYGATTLRNIVRVIMGEDMYAITKMTWQQLVDSCNFIWIDKRFTEKRWPLKAVFVKLPPDTPPDFTLTTQETEQYVAASVQWEQYICNHNMDSWLFPRHDYGSDEDYEKAKKRVIDDFDRAHPCGIKEVLRSAPMYLNPQHAGTSFVIPIPVKVGRKKLMPVIVDAGGGKRWKLCVYAMDETIPGFVLWFYMWRINPPTTAL